MCVHLSAVLWSSNLQEAYEIHGAVTCDFRVGLLTIFFRLLKCESPYYIGRPFGTTMVHMDHALQYLRFLLAPSLLSSDSIIWWSVDILGSLIPRNPSDA